MTIGDQTQHVVGYLKRFHLLKRKCAAKSVFFLEVKKPSDVGAYFIQAMQYVGFGRTHQRSYMETVDLLEDMLADFLARF